MADKTKVADVPFLLNQWDYEKNTEFNIHKMNVGSEKMVNGIAENVITSGL